MGRGCDVDVSGESVFDDRVAVRSWGAWWDGSWLHGARGGGVADGVHGRGA